MRRLIFAFFLFPVLAAAAAAVEISLEENKAESGTVGYVDIERVFSRFSLTKKEKEDFRKKIAERREFLNAKRDEVEKLKSEIRKLEKEKKTAVIMMESAEKQEIKKSTDAAKPETSLSISSAPQDGISVSSSPAESEDIPKTVSGRETASSTQTHKSDGIPTINLPGVKNVPLHSFEFTVSSSPAEIEAAILERERKITSLKNEMNDFRIKAEKELENYRKYKTQNIVLRIYSALRELAREEGVSVVMDKKNIIFGNSAVDLTDKLLDRLESGK